ncbi:eukaryotic translation initiation factor eIF2A-domain-containing protein [Mrakia frigida]|uniref:translation initiation factor 2A n=1 Tax=Mrakia frigida TaxID=29902 RepID=UPI003FCC2436
MAAAPSNQYALRAQKSLALVEACPSYTATEGFKAPEVHTRQIQYSPTGELFAYVLPTSVTIVKSETGELFRELAVVGAVEITFSPKGTYLSTWERYVKPEDPNAQHNNLRIFSTATGEEVMAFTNKSQENWHPAFPPSESYLIRQSGSEILLFSGASLAPKVAPVSRFRVEGLKGVWVGGGSEGEGVAVFVGEKNGAPATMSLYSVQTLSGSSPVATATKAFFKADKVTVKWNPAGSMALFLTTTDVDQTNKSYYGETNLYLVALRGGFECRVALDKEGPVHDFAWAPNSKEFGVVYGYMPAKTVLFDTKANPSHDLGLSPRNFLSYQPQSRLLLVAGFGNLSGHIDVWDRKAMKKVADIRAPNASTCEWSPCGKYIMTATLSPRLRVDNGYKVWWCAGGLLHQDMIADLYQAIWRPSSLSSNPPFPAVIPPAPAPSASVSSLPPQAPAPIAAGAYRPPGARGTATPIHFLREDQGGLPSSSSSNGGPAPSVYAVRGQQKGRAPPGSAPREEGENGRNGNAKTKGKKDRRGGAKRGESEEQLLAVAAPVVVEVVPEVVPESADPVAKKIRNLLKKLKAIDELKEKLAKGEKLEATQVLKIKNEGGIRSELASLEG